VKANTKNSALKPAPGNDPKSLPMPELQTRLHSSPDGLSQAEAQKRLMQYGHNEVADIAGARQMGVTVRIGLRLNARHGQASQPVENLQWCPLELYDSRRPNPAGHPRNGTR
jgi:hypothetical protein